MESLFNSDRLWVAIQTTKPFRAKYPYEIVSERRSDATKQMTEAFEPKGTIKRPLDTGQYLH